MIYQKYWKYLILNLKFKCALYWPDKVPPQTSFISFFFMNNLSKTHSRLETAEDLETLRFNFLIAQRWKISHLFYCWEVKSLNFLDFAVVKNLFIAHCWDVKSPNFLEAYTSEDSIFVSVFVNIFVEFYKSETNPNNNPKMRWSGLSIFYFGQSFGGRGISADIHCSFASRQHGRECHGQQSVYFSDVNSIIKEKCFARYSASHISTHLLMTIT